MSKQTDDMLSAIVDITMMPSRSRNIEADLAAEMERKTRLLDYPPRGEYSDDRPIFTRDEHPGTRAEQQESGDRCREASMRYGTKPESR